MLSQAALARLQDAATFWSVGSGTPGQVIAAACDCLAAGVDSPTLRILAGASCEKGRESDELRRWLEDAMTELSLTYYREGSSEGQEAALRIMVRRVLARDIAPRDLTAWAYLHIGWDGTYLAAELIAFENAYEYEDSIQEAYSNISTMTADVDADVIREAQRLDGDAADRR